MFLLILKEYSHFETVNTINHQRIVILQLLTQFIRLECFAKFALTGS